MISIGKACADRGFVARRFKVVVNCGRLYGCKKKIGPPWDVLFFGTDNFALHSLKALWAKLITGTILSSLGVVSKRGCQVRKFAESEGLTVYDWPLQVESIDSKYHIGMVVSFGNLIPENVINSFPLGCVNVHASLLPRWRGAAPIIHAVRNGDIETGITIMRIEPFKFDTGKIVRQYRLSIGPDETSQDVEDRLGVCGSNLLMECIRDMPRCLDKAIAQPDSGITYAPKVDSSMSLVRWSEMTALNVFNLHRALCHLYPLTTRWHGQPVKLHQISLDKVNTISLPDPKSSTVPEEQFKRSALDFLQSTSSTKTKKFDQRPPDKNIEQTCGTVSFQKQQKHLKVVCADGHCILIQRLSVGGKNMTAADFYNGFMTKKSTNERRFGT